MDALRIAWGITRTIASALWCFVWWTAQAWRWLLACGIAGNVLLILDHTTVGYLVLWCVPAFSLLRATWAAVHPLSYENVLGGPLRRRGWRRHLRKHWPKIAERCGLTLTTPDARVVPRLKRVRADGNTLTFQVRARLGHTLDDLTSAAEAIATCLGAEAVETRRLGAGWLELTLTMRELLHIPTLPTIPETIETGAVTLGRCSDGTPWRLDLTARHTLVVGRSGAGKGSIFWGIAGNLAPAAHAGMARLWGIDLKGGVEVSVGSPMFSHVAMNEPDAVRLLADLHRVIVGRQQVMRGHARMFTPVPGDPIHVLLIDELAVLTAYAAKDVVNEAATLLKLILTQGRAFGVMVVAFVQDPRKETVGMRDLFTQTIALRLASAAETRMVLGDGTAALAPAHHIAPTMPGAGYLVGDDGHIERVRADYWTDDFIRMVAATYPAPPTPLIESPTAENAASPGADGDSDTNTAADGDAPARPVRTTSGNTTPRKRKPRTPRQPATSGARRD
ncbi:S-DNA-T family DNA segregation ATPase FtsK/SpoIIIE [Isoptericola jiangsuensis]|uniref:S-DNA-T family DNA segregation ATPase FtsK/SpoIIIE n=1 Tax=Isoptericola jiangsuensis TaxID=548579 RepID=A0A2A9F182_9MICO|nr:FtsK/SpoIIIE domain-containing protein [Isoptericola jiangsuensis]PFG44566.1 S-DNA-T family DNA segregation ATPase FtsK/SpoIIIE [Isoptericola jiangsuensis]